MPESPDPHLDREDADSFQRGGNPTPGELEKLRNAHRLGEVGRLRDQLDAVTQSQPSVDLSSGSVRELDPDAVREDIRRLEDTP